MITITTVELILLTVVSAATPLLLAATGELVVERSGVLNLGVEGMMLVGAVSAFIAMLTTGSWALGIIAGAAAGVLMSMLFGILTLFFLANQVASGLALTLFGVGVSSLLGIPFIGLPIEKLPSLDIPLVGDIPIVGPLIFGQDFLIYFSVLMVVAVHWFLFRSRSGLILRAVGESHDAAHSIGYSVIKFAFSRLCLAVPWQAWAVRFCLYRTPPCGLSR